MFTDKAELANRSPPNLPESVAKMVVLFTCGFKTHSHANTM